MRRYGDPVRATVVLRGGLGPGSVFTVMLNSQLKCAWFNPQCPHPTSRPDLPQHISELTKIPDTVTSAHL